MNDKTKMVKAHVPREFTLNTRERGMVTYKVGDEVDMPEEDANSSYAKANGVEIANAATRKRFRQEQEGKRGIDPNDPKAKPEGNFAPVATGGAGTTDKMLKAGNVEGTGLEPGTIVDGPDGKANVIGPDGLTPAPASGGAMGDTSEIRNVERESPGSAVGSAPGGMAPVGTKDHEHAKGATAHGTALRKDGPTVAEYVAKGYDPEDYPPDGYAAVSTPAEVQAAIAKAKADKTKADTKGGKK